MEEQLKIPTGKVSRATKFVQTGVKVGGNYLKHYSKKLVDPSIDRSGLDEDNARDIYSSLSQLKGSALKVAQMLAMDKNLLPSAYQKQFSLGQYSAPPLSFPLVVKTFQQYFGKNPNDIFDDFGKSAANAASIGQVHRASLDGKSLAVKVQYPGVAESVRSDLKLVRPFAARLFSISDQELDHYLEEVEEKLLEETDYILEVRRSQEISGECGHITGLVFPTYYPELSSARIITMDWLEGKHIKEFLLTNPDQDTRNAIGQAMWDFYHHQIHNLKKVHADPHPGNFLMQADGTLGVIDFGCVKEIPQDFYDSYFKLMSQKVVTDDTELVPILEELNFVYSDDTKEERKVFIAVFKEMTTLLGMPFHTDTFDFADHAYFDSIYALGERLSKMKEIRNSKHARGSRHGLYINRTYFGLYQLLNQLEAKVVTTKPSWI
jgi:predicted unusual protein kinase regulating ubiquinone biosynthesis (AarF/ABC1/UbiB family)